MEEGDEEDEEKMEGSLLEEGARKLAGMREEKIWSRQLIGGWSFVF